MPSTQKLIIVSLALIAGIGLGYILSETIITDVPDTSNVNEAATVQSTKVVDGSVLKNALLPLASTRFSTTSTKFNSHQLLYVYPGLLSQDFDGVETVAGKYKFNEGYLWHMGDDSVVDSQSITDAGYTVLYKNILNRLALTTETPIETIVTRLENPEEIVPEPIATADSDSPVENPEEPTMCPMDAKQCPDGSFVGRTAPGCAFAECPSGNPPASGEIVCTAEQREAEACIEIYAPVCAAVEVQCVTTPCNPVPQTYPNGCFACAEDRVISYTEGECVVPTQ